MKINQIIGNLRKSAGLTLDQLAQVTGLTKSYLSKIERAHRPPPISTLITIARALGTDLDVFFTQDKNVLLHTSNLDFLKATEKSSEAGAAYRPLVKVFKNKYMSPFLITVQKGEHNYYKHDGEEFVYLIRGNVEFEYEGHSYQLQPGDSLYFNSRIKHCFKNNNKKDAVLVTVNFNYKRF